jgi:sec-independent protein translocase protein TatA
MPMGGLELIILLAIILMFFGAKRIPELARSLGKGSREFRKGLDEGEEEGSDKGQEKGPDKAKTRERSEKKASQQEDARLEEQTARAEPNSKA